MVAAAVIGSAVVGAGASTYAASKASKAAKGAAKENNALLQAAQDRAYATVDPYVQQGYTANNALSRIVGGTGYAATPMASAANSGFGAKPPGGMAGYTPSDPKARSQAPASNGLLSGGPFAQAINSVAASANAQSGGSFAGDGSAVWDAYMAENPDVAQRAQEGVAEGLIGPGKQWATPQAWAQYHYENGGKAEGRQLPSAPQAAPQPTYMGNPQYGPQLAPRPIMTRPSAPALDVSIENYQQSPDYEVQLSEGNRNILAQKSRLGGLESGDALKDLQKYGQDLALGDYSQWRGYETGQRNFEASRGDQNFNVDAARSDAQYDTDRGYLTSRFDTQVNDLFRLSGQGLQAAGTAINVGQNTANGMSNNNNSAASATGNAAIAGSNQVNNLLGTALQTYGMANSGYGGYSSAAPPPGSGYQPGRIGYTGSQVPF
jgi:hypothetical protein